jgi:hypothetical protein
VYTNGKARSSPADAKVFLREALKITEIRDFASLKSVILPTLRNTGGNNLAERQPSEIHFGYNYPGFGYFFGREQSDICRVNVGLTLK